MNLLSGTRSIPIPITMASIKDFVLQALVITSLYSYNLFLYAQGAYPFDNELLPNSQIQLLRSYKIDKLYQFGDSLSDAGNRLLEDSSYQCIGLPYGESCLLEPIGGCTGRCSDGLIMVDFMTLAFGLPALDAYMKANANFSHGVNFAVGSATALSPQKLAENNITALGTNSSLMVQVDWMEAHFASLCKSDKGCIIDMLKNALFIVGEIGTNEYSYGLLQDKTVEEVENTVVPQVVQVIMDAVRRIIDVGGVRILVPGLLPTGCAPASLTMFPSNNPADYDEYQCLRGPNDLAAYHNEYLRQAIEKLNEEYPSIVVVYADYYNGFEFLLKNASYFGFDVTLKACCGKGGDYNFDFTSRCGKVTLPYCHNPNSYISLDGVHLTQNAYRILTTWLLQDIIPKINLKSTMKSHNAANPKTDGAFSS